MGSSSSLLFTVCLLLGFLNQGYAQNLPDLSLTGTIHGTIKEKETEQPIEFATVALFSFTTGEIIDGKITNSNGQFSLKDLRLGAYNLEISFLGFKKTIISQILVLPKNPEIFLGDIFLEISIDQLEEITVTGEREEIIFKADRKIINIESSLTARGGSLVEALENQPSLKTDMNGNLTLRGSPNFTVLINGKPTALKGSDALNQIPANTVETVEIITNPSAKFDPEGEVGIINVIVKRDFTDGISGLANLSGGLTSSFLTNYATDANVQITREKLTYLVGFDVKHTPIDGAGTQLRRTISPSGDNSRESDMDIGITRNNYTVNTGIVYTPNIETSFSLDANLGALVFERVYDSEIISFSDTTQFIISNTQAKNDNVFGSATMGFEHMIDVSTGHKLTGSVFYSINNPSKVDNLIESSATNHWTPLELIVDQNSLEDGINQQIRLNTDYSLPLNNKEKHFEAGSQYRFEKMELSQSMQGVEQASTNLLNSVNITRNIFAGYIQYTGSNKSINYQLGLRPEYTNRVILESVNEFEQQYFRVFPSFNAAFNTGGLNQLNFGYSQRINRPAESQLNPYIQFLDEKNRRSGNTSLLPEYVHSFEVNLVNRLLFTVLSVDIFYRQTQNKISQVWLPQTEEDVYMVTYDNLNKDYSYGTEVMIGGQITNWWRANLSTSIYRYNINGTIEDEDISNSSNSWNARMSSTIRLDESRTVFQLNMLYNSDVASSQGQREGFFATMLALKQPFFDEQFEASLQVRDVFNTIQFSNVNESAVFNNQLVFSPYTPIVSLTVTYRFKNYNKPRTNQNVVKIDFQDDFKF